MGKECLALMFFVQRNLCTHKTTVEKKNRERRYLQYWWMLNMQQKG